MEFYLEHLLETVESLETLTGTVRGSLVVYSWKTPEKPKRARGQEDIHQRDGKIQQRKWQDLGKEQL
jgi:hypothetical protein